MYLRPGPLSIPPQLGTGGGIPKPRKLRVASARIAEPIPIENMTISPGIILGRTCRINILVAEAPIACGACTYIFSLIPITKLLPPETIDKLVERTIKGGAEIIDLLKTGSAFYAPSAAVAQMVEAVILDKKQVLPCAAYIQGEYGIKDSVVCVPVKLGRNGIEQIMELELTPDEKQALANSANAVRELVNSQKSSKT